MPEPVSLSMVQFLNWVADRPRTYAEAMDAWRTSCPRLSVWEDSIIAGYVRVGSGKSGSVSLTPRGREILASRAATTQSEPEKHIAAV